jgi:hypothetical protein
MHKSRFSPTVNISNAEAKCNGLTFTEVVEKDYTYTLGQLRLAATTDVMKEHRHRAVTLTYELVKKYRYELYNSCGGVHRLVTNGYGQLKYIEIDDKRLTAKQIFDKLEQILA